MYVRMYIVHKTLKCLRPPSIEKHFHMCTLCVLCVSWKFCKWYLHSDKIVANSAL